MVKVHRHRIVRDLLDDANQLIALVVEHRDCVALENNIRVKLALFVFEEILL